MNSPITSQQHYARIVGAMPGFGRHEDQIHAYADSIQAAVESGQVAGGQPRDEEIIRQWHMNQAASYAGRNRERLLRALADGGWQAVFDLGADHARPILVCDSRTLRDYFHRDFRNKHTVLDTALNADDLLLLDKFKHRQRVDLDDLDDKTGPLLRAGAQRARDYASVTAAFAAGALDGLFA